MRADCEEVKPYGETTSSKAEEVKEMFNNISRKYDFMNRAMTLGLDKSWRRKAIKELASSDVRNVLDIACGTGDMAIAIARLIPEAKVTGIDLSQGMLEEGMRKVNKQNLSEQISLMEGDSLAMPFTRDSFDGITVAFGVRNFENLAKGYAEMLRVLKPGGKLVVLELSTPSGKLSGLGYRIYTRYLIPGFGKLVSGDSRAYSYLPESIAAVPQRERMTALMEEAGFVNAKYRELTLGTCTIYTGIKDKRYS